MKVGEKSPFITGCVELKIPVCKFRTLYAYGDMFNATWCLMEMKTSLSVLSIT